MPELAGSPIGDVRLVDLGTHTAGGFPLQLPEAVQSEAQLIAWYRAWKPKYAAGTMRVLRAVINTAMRLDETLGKNPVDVLKLPSPKVRKVAPLDLAEWWTRVEALSPVRRDYHIASLLTGARRGSLCPVRRADVDLDKQVLTFEHQKTSDEPLLFPVGRRLASALRWRT